MSKALVLFSGGQDSTTCLALAQKNHPDQVEAVIFDYGQRHRIELQQAHRIAQKANIPLTVVDLTFISQLTANALTRSDMKIEHQTNQLPSTFVPGRNLFFLSAAAAIAYERKIPKLYTGVCQTDYSGYPDCRDPFIQSVTQTINLAMESQIEIVTPLMHLTKAQSVLLMQQLGKLEWYKESHTCYEGKRPACGQCPACILRLKGFKEAGLDDPLEYESESDKKK